MQETRDKTGGFRFVVVKIKLVIIRGIEPFPEPVTRYGWGARDAVYRSHCHGIFAFSKIR